MKKFSKILEGLFDTEKNTRDDNSLIDWRMQSFLVFNCGENNEKYNPDNYKVDYDKKEIELLCY